LFVLLSAVELFAVTCDDEAPDFGNPARDNADRKYIIRLNLIASFPLIINYEYSHIFNRIKSKVENPQKLQRSK
jgi:hypothetical protein